MERLFISKNDSGHVFALKTIEKLKRFAAELNELFSGYSFPVLTTEVLADCILNRAKRTKLDYEAQLEGEIKRLKITSPSAKKSMMESAVDFHTALDSFLTINPVSQYRPLLQYIEVQKGEVVAPEQKLEELEESFKTYAAGPDQLEVHKAQQDASQALTRLKVACRKAFPDTSFIIDAQFFSSFFSIDGDTVRPVEVPYTK